jgi:(1->4)-alpha-D-glucan 1-alpha-D-glucosylmutase
LLVYQTLVGAWPITRDRLDTYLEKALREGKVSSNWLDPDVEHERAVQAFAARAADVMRDDPFLERVAALGRRIALGQLLLKLTSPGLPDIYQGDELEDLSLVDPDNRRPVDWTARTTALAELRAGGDVSSGTEKLHVTWRTLALRAGYDEAFATGAYEPADVGEGVFAFTRAGEVLVAVATSPDVEPALPVGWRDVLGVRGIALCVRT